VEDYRFGAGDSYQNYRTDSFQSFATYDSDVISIGDFQVKESGISFADYDPKQSIKDELVFLHALGQGAGGIVYKAIHRPTMRCVAVKTIPVYDPVKRAQMLKELKALYANMAPILGSPTQNEDGGQGGAPNMGYSSSPNRPAKAGAPCPFIVTFHDAFINSEQCNVNIVVEYMDGGSLEDIIDMGGCDNEDVLSQISYRILQGLRYIHKQHQIHRDIKPANLLINHRGEVKVSDFGIVRELDSTQAAASTFVGTLTYMSPERISGHKYTANSDVWSFGLSIMSVALGTYPLSTTGGYWALLASLNDAPVPSLPADRFSPEFIDFVDQCLERDPSRRPEIDQLMQHPFILRAQEAIDAQMELGENAPPTNEANQINEINEILLNYMEKSKEDLDPESPRLKTLSHQFGVSLDIIQDKIRDLSSTADTTEELSQANAE
jgi:serine/threonine protein kinase